MPLMTCAMPQTFPKARRLGRRADFQRVYERGTKAHGRFMTLFVIPNALEFSRLGIAATKKIGGATIRNRAKRRTREVFRTTSTPAGLDMVVVARRELIEAPWSDLREEFSALLGRQRRATSRRSR